MNDIIIDLKQTNYSPGEVVRGSVSWQLAKPPRVVYLVIGWATQGRGTDDETFVHEEEWKTEQLNGAESFSFTLPPSPYSFVGSLIELNWFVSAETKKGKATDNIEIVMGPNQSNVSLYTDGKLLA